MSEQKKPKRIIVPTKRGDITDPVVVPTVDALITDGLSIIGGELAQLRAKIKRGVTLSKNESVALRGYLDSLVKLSKEMREQARSEDLTNMSDEELLKMLAEVSKIDFKAGESDK